MKKKYETKIKHKVPENVKNTGGITLIALIITIIVLLILAGVSISMIVGDNGILSQAGKAKIETKKASIKEEVELALDAIITEEIKTANQKTQLLLEELDERYELVDQFETEEKDEETVQIAVKIDNSEYLFKHVENGVETYFTVNLKTNEVKMLDGTEFEETLYGKERTIVFKLESKFFSNGSNIIAEYTTNNNKKLSVSRIPQYTNYVFIGWDTNNDGIADITKDVTETRVLKDEVWIALYKSDGEGVVSVENGILSDGSSYGVYAIDTLLSIKAENMLDGKYFNGWTFDGGETIVSTRLNYSFYVKGDLNIIAIYGESAITLEPKVGFYKTSRIRDEETGKDKVTIGILWDANISGYTVLEEGILRTFEEESVSNLNLDMLEIDSNITQKICGDVEKHGSYTYNLSISETSEYKTKDIYVRGYITYKAPDGNTNTIYTSVKCLEALE